MSRYQQHLNLPQIGDVGQKTLAESHALIIGAGGLGVPVAMYLNAAGIGRISISDFDRIENSNLQRQVLYNESDIGDSKADVAVHRLAQQNPATKLTSINHALQGNALMQAVAAADVVLDCCDNFETRFALNDACVAQQTPLVSGAALGMAGQVIVFDSGEDASPCYRCLYSDSLSSEETCAVAGVMGPLVGVIGTTQALAAIQVLLNQHPSVGELQLFDAQLMQWRRINVRKDPDCPVCG